MNLIREVAKQVNRPFSVKFLETQGLIAKNIAEFRDKIAVAFSGGKDSLIVLVMTHALYPDIKVVFNDTGVEYPETRAFINETAKRLNLDLIVTKPIKTFWQCVEQYGFAEGKRGASKKREDNCCYWLKEKPMKDAIKQLRLEAMLTGQTASENRTRMFSARDYGACFYSKKWKLQRIHPILWWTEDEVRGYIQDMNIPNNPLYAKGISRVGCMPCTAHKYWESQLSEFNPKLYALIKLRKDKQYVMAEGSRG